MKQSPLQRVRSEFGSKDALAEKVLGVLELGKEEDRESLGVRVRGMSNAKLLRLWDAHKRVGETFGSKDALVEKLVKIRYPNGHADYQRKLESYTAPRLLDLARQEKVKG